MSRYGQPIPDYLPSHLTFLPSIRLVRISYTGPPFWVPVFMPPKYRPTPKRLSDLSEESIAHGFTERITVPLRSQAQGSDPGYYGVLDLSGTLEPERPDTSHQLFTTHGSNFRSWHAGAEAHVPALPSSSRGTSRNRRRVSASRPLTSGRLPHSVSGKSTGYRPASRQMPYNATTRHIPYTRNHLAPPPSGEYPYPGSRSHGIPSRTIGSSGPRLPNVRYPSTPEGSYNGFIPSMREPQMLQAPPPYGYQNPVSRQGIPIPGPSFQVPSSNYLSVGQPGLQDPLRPQRGSSQVSYSMTDWLRSYSTFPHTSQIAEQGPSTETYPAHYSTPNQVPYTSGWSDRVDTYGLDLNRSTTHATPAWPFGADFRPMAQPDFVQGSSTADSIFNHPTWNNVEMYPNNGYNNYGHVPYSPTYPGTAQVPPASSGIFPSISMGNTDGFHDHNESTSYPQDGYFYGPPGNNGF